MNEMQTIIQVLLGKLCDNEDSNAVKHCNFSDAKTAKENFCQNKAEVTYLA